MDALTSPCPVPTEQQPLNEYTNLRESWFYRWATLDRRGYIIPFVWIWGLGWLLVSPIAASSFSPSKYLVQFLLTSALGAGCILALPLLRLYLGWFYIRDRLSRDKIFYEESGWYDGQIWEKPAEVVARDRLIVTHQVEPVLKRLNVTFGLLAVGLLSDVILCFCLSVW